MKSRPVFKLRIIVVLSVLIFLSISLAIAQEKEVVKEKAEKELQKMTPEQIDAKIKELGMTRGEAEAKAKEYGVDLETYLQRKPSPVTQISLPAATPAKGALPASVQKITIEQAQRPADTTVNDVSTFITPKTEPIVAKEEIKKRPGDLEYFGYSIFKTSQGVFEPRPLLDNEYVLGEGDVLKISLWGEVQNYNEYKVDTEGRILISAVGPVFVAGLTLERARKAVLSSMSTAFSGLTKTPPTIFMDISIARIRPIRVFMMGEVENPGGYAVSNFASVFNSLFAVNGPKLSGSLREVRVSRNNKIISKVDIYDYLIGSQKTNDVRVNDNDIIFVPLRGRTVGIVGEVLRPAKYELLPEENLKKLIDFAGGLRSNIYIERIQVNRIIPFSERVKGEPERKIFDIDFKEIIKSSKDYKLEDGDIVTLFPISDRRENYVVIQGAVYRPGTYQKDKVHTVKDLVVAADSLLPEAYLNRAEITRTYPDQRREALHINLGLALEGDPSHNIRLMKFDQLRIYSTYEINEKRTVSIQGHVKAPGTYPFAENQTLYDLLFMAGGLEDSLFRSQTYLERGNLARLNPDLRTRRMIYVNVSEVFDKKEGDILLLPDDEIRIFSRQEMREPIGSVEIQGKAKRPGTYPLRSNLTLYDLIYDAVGLTDTLFRKEVLLETADFIRLNPDRITSRIIRFDLWKLFTERAGDTTLLDGDRIIIYPKAAVEFVDRYVEIFGSVKNPGRYTLAENMTIVDLLLQAGGYTEDAYAVQAEVARISRSGLGKDSLVYTRFAELPDLFDTTSTKMEVLLKTRIGSFHLRSKDQVFIRPNPEYVSQRLVTIEGEVKYSGRYALQVHGERVSNLIMRAGGVTKSAYLRGARLTRDGTPLRLNLEDAVHDDGGTNDVVLKPGDIIRVPLRPGTVIIRGEIQNPGIYGYMDGNSLSNYIDRAGGELDSADYAIITFPEGDSKKVGLGWFSSNPHIPDGSDILITKVPPKPPEPPQKESKTTFTEIFKDTTAIIATTLTILVLARQIK